MFKVSCSVMVKVISGHYLNQCPSMKEKGCAMKTMEWHGFPGGSASWDCKQFNWKNFPVCMAGQHRNHHGWKGLILEAICNPDLYIWYFFGQPGYMSDINIKNKSSIVGLICQKSLTQPACHNELKIVCLIGFTSLLMAYIHLGPFLSDKLKSDHWERKNMHLASNWWEKTLNNALVFLFSILNYAAAYLILVFGGYCKHPEMLCYPTQHDGGSLLQP